MTKYLIPLTLFLFIGGILLVGLRQDPSHIPSPLIGKPFPDFQLPLLEDDKKIITLENLRGRPFLLNVWASWCASCYEEHATLLALAKQENIFIIGLNYKDQRADAEAFIRKLGNPYALIITDLSGQFGLELGVYGAPETFFVDAQGIIQHKHVGPITMETAHNLMVHLTP